MNLLSNAAGAALARRRLVWVDGGVEWAWCEVEVATPLWMLAEAATRLLTSEEMALLRACDSPTCRWLFVDTSKNHSRRWCDMKVCGNRIKARRFYRRERAGQKRQN
jgi:predicted RNA-binding Zn ribbon-like protein